MIRVYPDFAYSAGPRDGCWWDETCAVAAAPVLQGDVSTDIAIIGAGFTGLSAAFHLAEAGHDVVVVDAEQPGWGASGRNGGFCCIGGSKVSDATLDRRFGKADRLAYRRTEAGAVDFVAALLDRLVIDADTHSKGETVLAHRAHDFEGFQRDAEEIEATYGVAPMLIPKPDLAASGMAGPFFGAMTTPIGFGLNPRKYLLGLVGALKEQGGRLFGQSVVTQISRDGDNYRLRSAGGEIVCRRVVIATNGYSSDAVPDAMAGRYLPAQSNVLVTRPLTDAELDSAGWTTDQMAYDTRNLLHYFRLMPDRRFLFGMRGGLNSSPSAEASARRMVRRDFERMFPSWRHVETPNAWSGLVCLTRSGLPYVGPLDGHYQIFAAFGYHGNGVAMGSYAGALVADLVAGVTSSRSLPRAMSSAPPRFPFGRFRRAVLPPAYAIKGLADL